MNKDMLKFAVGTSGQAGKAPDFKHGRVGGKLTVGTLAEILDVLPEPIYLKDRSHRWVMANSAFCKFIGCEHSELLGKTERDFFSDREANAAWENDEMVFATGQAVVNETLAVSAAQRPRFLQTHRSLLRDAEDNDLLLCVLREVDNGETDQALLLSNSQRNEDRPVSRPNKLKRLSEQEIRFAFSDPLTRLPNRRSFINLLDAAATRVADSAAVFVINIDHFKLVNNRFGYSAGDIVILEVADRLRSSIRSIDILGRLDSDAFIVFADDIDTMQAELIVDKILATISRPLKLSKHDYRISVSVGMAMFPDHGRNAEDLMRNAGMAMQWCKRRRRGGSEFYSDSASLAAGRMATIELRLPLALEQDLISVHYQPIVGSVDRAVLCFEALARWSDPELGELTPAEFIPIAEEMGLIRRLGETVLDQACEFAASLKNSRTSVWVNVSGLQLMDETFPIFVAETLQKHNISGDRLLLEITESVAMDADSGVRQVFDELTGIGVRLVIDDFGTGFSNLARLKQLPFAAIKIDREFIRGLPHSSQDGAIFRATYAIAKEMNLQIVAEGIENAEQENFVRQFEVDFLQGYKFGCAMPVDKLQHFRQIDA